MELREYLFRNKITGFDFAKSINYNAAYISHLNCGRRKPGKKLIKIIHDATNGQVTFDDWEIQCKDH